MTIFILVLFVGVCLVSGALVLFFYAVKNRDLTCGDSLSLLPLEDDDYAK